MERRDSETLATYGGGGLGAHGLVIQEDLAFSLLGTAWLAAAGGRVLLVVVDQSRGAKNLGDVFFEGYIGVLLLL